jgi:hypothetical protein
VSEAYTPGELAVGVLALVSAVGMLVATGAQLILNPDTAAKKMWPRSPYMHNRKTAYAFGAMFVVGPLLLGGYTLLRIFGHTVWTITGF